MTLWQGVRWLVCITLVSYAFDQVRAEEGLTELILGFEAGKGTQIPDPWFVPTRGWRAELWDEDAVEGARCAKLWRVEELDAPFGNLMRNLDAAPHRGRKVKLTAKLRVEGGGRAMMWLRVDRKDNRRGFFDNMGNRPITSKEWTDAVIEGEVAADATQLALGVMALDGATVFIDDMQLGFSGTVEFQSDSPATTLTNRQLDNLAAATRLVAYLRFFHPSDQALSTEWDHLTVDLMRAVENAEDSNQLAQTLTEFLEPIAPGVQVWAGDKESAPPPPARPDGATHLRYWVHRGAGSVAKATGGFSIYSSTPKRRAVDSAAGDDSAGATAPPKDSVVKSLGGGLACRVPVVVMLDEEGSLPRGGEDLPWASTKDQPRLTVTNRGTRLAGVAKLWGVMRHFYPYFDVVDTDWDAALRLALADASSAEDETAYAETLQRLVAKLHDGHGGVYGIGGGGLMLPLVIDWSSDLPIVMGTHESAPEEISVGDVLCAVNGERTEDLAQRLAQRISAATDGWRRYRLSSMITRRPAEEEACALTLRHPDGSEYEVVTQPIPPAAIEAELPKPENATVLAEGIVYFDLNGASTADLNQVIDKLSAAKGIVFDLRGYPSDGARDLVTRLNEGRTKSAQWNVPVIMLPDGEGWTWQQSAWDLPPQQPQLDAKIAFLTDGRAISYAESIMGIIEHYQLGEIVGSTTAGTNGNVNPFELPGGGSVSWTGMKVLKHDGSQHHGVGIEPTQPVTPTPAGVAAGKDEVLEKAVETLQAQIGS